MERSNRLSLETLENRDNPSVPTFDWQYNASSLNDWEAFGADTGGGPRVQVFHQGQLVTDQFVFKPDFRGGVDVSWSRDGDLMVAAGAGGGPRVRIFNAQGGEPLEDYFAFDPASRDGCAILHGVVTTPYQSQKRETLDYDVVVESSAVPAPIQTYFATPYSEKPGNPTLMNSNLAKLPENIQVALARIGFISYVFHGQYVSETMLGREYGFNNDELTDAVGDSARTNNQVGGFQSSNFMILADNIYSTLANHEVGHGVQFLLLTKEQADEWLALYNVHKGEFYTDYENGSPYESFAECFRRWIAHFPNPNFAQDYMNRVIPRIS
jgi:hypothetical protein